MLIPMASDIFFGGTIITVNDSQPRAEAIAIADGKIIAIGDKNKVLVHRFAQTNLIDLQGKTLMPGFIEPHSHPLASAFVYDWIDVSGFNNPNYQSIIEKLTVAARSTPPGQWILAFGYDPILLRDCHALSADILDAISTEHPIFVMMQVMHTVYVNHKALKFAGITDDTPNPSFGGEFGRDTAGQLTGEIKEIPAIMPFITAINFAADHDANIIRVNRQLDRYAKRGITTVGIAGLLPIIPNAKDLLLEVMREKDAPIRFCHYLAGNVTDNLKEVPFSGDDNLRNIGIKYWYDGSPYTGTAYINQPYIDSELTRKGLGLKFCSCGHTMFQKSVLQARIQAAHDVGWQVAVHCQGDKAIHDVIEIYAAVLQNNPRKDHRHRLEHLALAQDNDLQRAEELGITLSFHMNHLYYYGEALRDDIFGVERTEQLMPVGSAKKYGHRFSLHADSPMYPADPLHLMGTAISRKTQQGSIIGQEQAISFDDAVKAVTINAAWQLFMEDKIGSLEVGKYADFAILAQNPYDVAPEKLHNIEVIATYKNGRRTRVSSSFR